MAKNKNIINIKKVLGNVVSSNNQSGGVTAHNYQTTDSQGSSKKKKKPFFNRWYVQLIGLVSAIFTILAYFGYQPTITTPTKSSIPKKRVVKSDSIQIKRTITQDTTKKKKPILKKKHMFNKKDENPPVTVGNVNGDVVISQNQTGGITAHTVNQYGKPIPEARHINSDDKSRLDNLDKNNLVIVVISIVDNEANNYGGELIKYLKDKGFTLQVDGYQQGIGSGNKRFDVTPSDDKSVRVFVPTQN